MEHDLTIPTLTALYLDALATEGKSPRTISAYHESLSIYMATAKAEGLPLQADQLVPADVYRHIAAIRRRGVCDATQHRRHREMKSFYSWLKRMELVRENPFQKVPLIRLEQKIVQPFSPEQLAVMLAAYDETTLLGARNRAIVLLLLDAGLRASELTNLDVADVDLETGRARILHGKGKKQRVIAFGPTVAAAIDHYLQVRNEGNGPLFQTRQGQRMRPEGLIVLFQRLSKTTGIPHIHAHRFRHSFATMAIRSAAREIDVQHLLGHSTSAMVRRYTRTYDAEQAAEAHATFSPVATLHLPASDHRPRRLDCVPSSSESSGPPRAGRTPTMTITNRNLSPGTRLTATHKGQTYTAEVIGEDHALRFRLEDGREFTSLSSAGKAVMGGVSCNGWRFWSIAGDRKPTPKKKPSARKRRAAASTIQRMENQTGASGDAVRYYCSACQEPFESPVGVVPTACPKGHSDNA